MKARRGETPDAGRWLDAQRDSLATRSGDAPYCFGHGHLCNLCHTEGRRPWNSSLGEYQHVSLALGVSLMN